MTLEKQIVIDKIEILEDGTVQIRKVTRILEDGVELSHTYWRTTITPDQEDLSEFNDDSRVSAVTGALWTEDVKTAYAAKKTSMQSKMSAPK
jgi:hypothetical protein